MSKSKLGEVLDGAIKLTFCSPENCDIWVPEIDCPAKHGYLCKREILETEIAPADIVEIDVEKIKLIILEWQDLIEKRSKRSSGIFAYDRNVLAETLAENADILKFKSK